MECPLPHTACEHCTVTHISTCLRRMVAWICLTGKVAAFIRFGKLKWKNYSLLCVGCTRACSVCGYRFSHEHVGKMNIVFVCMYMSVYVYLCVRACICMHVDLCFCIYALLHLCEFVWLRVWVRTLGCLSVLALFCEHMLECLIPTSVTKVHHAVLIVGAQCGRRPAQDAHVVAKAHV